MHAHDPHPIGQPAGPCAGTTDGKTGGTAGPTYPAEVLEEDGLPPFPLIIAWSHAVDSFLLLLSGAERPSVVFGQVVQADMADRRGRGTYTMFKNRAPSVSLFPALHMKRAAAENECAEPAKRPRGSGEDGISPKAEAAAAGSTLEAGEGAGAERELEAEVEAAMMDILSRRKPGATC